MIGALLTALVLAGVDGGPKTEPLEFQSRVNPSQVQLGQPFIYELVVTHHPAERFELQRPKELGDFEWFDVQRSRIDGPDGKSVTTFKARMALFALGIKTLPDVTFDVIGEGGAQTWVARGIDVEGLSTLPPDAEEEGAELHDIRPPEEVPVRSYRLLWILAGLLAAAGLGYALYRYLKNRQAAPIPVAPPLPLGQRTRNALDALAAEDLPSNGRSQEFYFRLSEIVRGYIGERYGFEALECTSSELIQRLQRTPTPGLPVEEVSRFSTESDLVKFARADAPPEQCKGALELAYRVLELTWPPPPPATIASSPQSAAPTVPPPPAHGPGTGVQ